MSDYWAEVVRLGAALGLLIAFGAATLGVAGLWARYRYGWAVALLVASLIAMVFLVPLMKAVSDA